MYRDPRTIVGFEGMEDAGIFQIAEDQALVQTVDFFTPIVDDPYMFGQIAAANALSDVYAKGGIPITALNLICFPIKRLDIQILRSILQGGADKLREAQVTLLGGHSVEDDELKYGLAVTGLIHPKRIIRNLGCIPGDRLILTKPLGTGIINTAIKAEMADAATIAEVQQSMSCLNAQASQILSQYTIHAGTDITGFGLIGHVLSMLENSQIGAELWPTQIPLFPKSLEFAAMGLVPAGSYRNRKFRESQVVASSSVPREVMDLLYDPQTSGGLLFSIASNEASQALQELHQAGISKAAIIGECILDPKGKILVK